MNLFESFSGGIALPGDPKQIWTVAFRPLLTFLVVFSATVFSAPAQSYSIDWFTIDGGGGTSTGAPYQVSGTIGQPDAGTMSGGNYTLDGGFWSIVATTQTPGAPLLTISLNSQLSTINISWPSPSTGFVLEQNSSLTNPDGWSVFGGSYNDNGTTKSITISPPTGNLFYRLKR